MEEKNVLDLILKIKELVAESEVDAEKVIKGNKAAAVRVRKAMQTIKQVAQEIRVASQDCKK